MKPSSPSHMSAIRWQRGAGDSGIEGRENENPLLPAGSETDRRSGQSTNYYGI